MGGDVSVSMAVCLCVCECVGLRQCGCVSVAVVVRVYSHACLRADEQVDRMRASAYTKKKHVPVGSIVPRTVPQTVP